LQCAHVRHNIARFPPPPPIGTQFLVCIPSRLTRCLRSVLSSRLISWLVSREPIQSSSPLVIQSLCRQIHFHQQAVEVYALIFCALFRSSTAVCVPCRNNPARFASPLIFSGLPLVLMCPPKRPEGLNSAVPGAFRPLCIPSPAVQWLC